MAYVWWWCCVNVMCICAYVCIIYRRAPIALLGGGHPSIQIAKVWGSHAHFLLLVNAGFLGCNRQSQTVENAICMRSHKNPIGIPTNPHTPPYMDVSVSWSAPYTDSQDTSLVLLSGCQESSIWWKRHRGHWMPGWIEKEKRLLVALWIIAYNWTSGWISHQRGCPWGKCQAGGFSLGQTDHPLKNKRRSLRHTLLTNKDTSRHDNMWSGKFHESFIRTEKLHYAA